jgi:hypothetical protein
MIIPHWTTKQAGTFAPIEKNLTVHKPASGVKKGGFVGQKIPGV